MAQTGLSPAQAIDLTGDDDEQSLPWAPAPASKSLAAIPVAEDSEVELEVLVGHRELGEWKIAYFKQYHMERELHLVQQFPLDSAIIRTIVPDRYLRVAGARPLLSKQTVAQRAKPQRKQANEPGFPGIIEINNGITAIKKAYKEHSLQHCRDVGRLALFTDGSSRGRNRNGSAVVFRRPEPGFTGWSPWQAYGFKAIGQEIGAHESECLAIIKAMDIARDLAMDNPGWPNSLYIYTDAQGILQKLYKTQRRGKRARDALSDPLMQFMVKKGKAICALVPTVVLVWCPSHSNVPGNELADRVAALAAKHTYENENEYIDLSSDEESEEMKVIEAVEIMENKRREEYARKRAQERFENSEDESDDMTHIDCFGRNNLLRGTHLAVAKDGEPRGTTSKEPPPVQREIKELMELNTLEPNTSQKDGNEVGKSMLSEGDWGLSWDSDSWDGRTPFD
ncbi:hypothetical protein K491DRAFT_677969 [Lophiostoma macrostomum CBS 122681]|uniref:RNase H type-1 domain-containing protein n=1 Tax=Lophiostoma macrostomum CBS 122681 TaxID=1314788 RepID=A0A6A6TC68_9PLEO|nr:hypothetical protein K491DRAFT_677969 [Lophiostoma macrostomum CBS 122681]